MKRRNFVLGLGALAIGSGAITTSAADLTDSTSSATDFRVATARELTVKRHGSYDHLTPGDNAVSGDGIETSNLNPGDLPAAYVTDEKNDNLAMNVVIRADADEDILNNFIQISNHGDSDEAVSMEYSAYGSAVDSGPFTYEAAREIFQFIAKNTVDDLSGDQVFSPDPTTGDKNPSVTISPGETLDLALRCELSGDQVSTAVNNASGVGNPFGGDVGTGLQLLEEITIHTSDPEPPTTSS